jgi:hypothetical protein
MLACASVGWAQQSIEVLTPNGGERYEWGDTMRITWAATEIPQVVVELTMDDGDNWFGLYGRGISPTSAGWLDTFWVVQPYVAAAGDTVSTASTTCRVRIFNYVGGYPSDVSDSVFTIADSTTVAPPPMGTGDKSGCGSGTGTALLVPVGFRVARRWRKRKRTGKR